MIEFKMPSLGADMDAGVLTEWKVEVGDRVNRGDIIAEVEIQKGVVEIEIFDEGIVHELLVKVDEKVPVGTVIALIDDGKGVAATEIKEAPKKVEEEVPPSIEKKPVPEVAPVSEQKQPEEKAVAPEHSVSSGRIRATPLARKIAADNRLSLENIQGSGDSGAITQKDVLKAIEKGPQSGSSDKKPHVKKTSQHDTSAIRKAVAAAMNKSNWEIPHYYLEKSVDMTAALEWLAAYNKKQSPRERLLPVVLLLKAAALALRDVPELNAKWENDELSLSKDINIGFVVSLKGGGIIVPALHHTDQKSLPELMAALNDIIPRARAMKLRSSEMTDATVTVTSLGDNAADKVFGVIYPPQTSIIGLGSVLEQPVAINGMLAVRKIMHATIAADHRASDGLSGSKFLNKFNEYLQYPSSL